MTFCRTYPLIDKPFSPRIHLISGERHCEGDVYKPMKG